MVDCLPTMPKEPANKVDLLQGTLDMLILRTLLLGPAHGHHIAKHIQRTTDDVLQVEHGSLYPALHRLERKGWLASKWEAKDGKRELEVLPADALRKETACRGGVEVEDDGVGHRAGDVAGRGGLKRCSGGVGGSVIWTANCDRTWNSKRRNSAIQTKLGGCWGIRR